MCVQPPTCTIRHSKRASLPKYAQLDIVVPLIWLLILSRRFRWIPFIFHLQNMHFWRVFKHLTCCSCWYELGKKKIALLDLLSTVNCFSFAPLGLFVSSVDLVNRNSILLNNTGSRNVISSDYYFFCMDFFFLKLPFTI